MSEMRWVNQVILFTYQAAWKPTWDVLLQLQPVLISLCMSYTWVHTQAESVCTKAVCWGDVFKLCFYHNATYSLLHFWNKIGYNDKVGWYTALGTSVTFDGKISWLQKLMAKNVTKMVMKWLIYSAWWAMIMVDIIWGLEMFEI